MSLLRRGRHRKKKMPESFPLVIMGFAVLIGISGIGFFLSPGPSEEPPYSAQTPYSAPPSEKGTETPRVTPTPKTSSTASKPAGSVTKPVTRKPSATPKPSTTPKPPTKPSTKPSDPPTDPPKTDPALPVYEFDVYPLTDCTLLGPGLHLIEGLHYFSHVDDKIPGHAFDHKDISMDINCPSVEPSVPVVSDILNVLS